MFWYILQHILPPIFAVALLAAMGMTIYMILVTLGDFIDDLLKRRRKHHDR